jgi:hypothetical protein
MTAPLNTCATIEQRGIVRFLWAKIMEAAKDIHKQMLPIGQHHKEVLPTGQHFFVDILCCSTLKPVPTLPR